MRWTYDRSPDPERPTPHYSVAGTSLGTLTVMQHELDCGTQYAVALDAVGAAAFDAVSTRHGLSGTITFGGASGPAVLLVGLGSTHDAGGRRVGWVAERLVNGRDAAQITALEERHRAWWQQFWAASQVQYGDPAIERLWYMGLYALGASTRPNTSPPNLQGIWVQDEISPWHADFHFNTNVQECQWGACGANHPELQQALVQVLTADWHEELKRTGREVYGVDAAAPSVAVDWCGRAISSWGFLELSTMAWTAQHLWEQYLYTQDRELLRETIYPYLQDGAKLYLALLVADETGQLNIELSHSPEQIWFDAAGKRYFAYGRNPSIDLSCIRTLFEAVIEAAQILGDDQAFSQTCQDALDRLAPLPVLDGVLIDYETAFFHDGDRAGRFPHCHRHPSRLMPIFPGRQIGLHSDEATLDLGRRSFREFRSYGEEGFTGWSYAYQACIAARLGLA